MPGPYGDSTRCLKAVGVQAVPGQPVAPAPVPASTYHLSSDEFEELDTYGRSSNPTWRQLESAIAQLEGATAALVFGSGMAAITSVLRALVRPRGVLVVPADGYYQVRRYAVEYLARQGITVREATAGQMCEAAADADVVLAETPVNPQLDVVDLHRLALMCRSRGATLVVDNTAATPLGQQPLGLGADLVVAAGLRLERQCRNAQALATMLHSHPAVRSVRYPGLPDDPAYPTASAQMQRFGGLVAFELADGAAVHEMVARSDLLIAATSFGGIHTSVDRRARWGDQVVDGFARLSAGIEDTDDLVADVESALSAV